MIAEIIKYPNAEHSIGIKPVSDPEYLEDLWELMYDCGFNNMTIGCHNGYMNVLNLYTQPIYSLQTLRD